VLRKQRFYKLLIRIKIKRLIGKNKMKLIKKVCSKDILILIEAKKMDGRVTEIDTEYASII